MKRMLTMAAAAAVLCTTLCGGLSLGASAADEQAPAPMKLRLMQGFSYEGKAVGDDIGVSGEYKVQVNGPATAKLSESLGALGAANAATFDSEEQTGFSESKYFREVFKKHYKMSPTKYAKEGSNSSPIITEDNLSDD